jgi:asparagine synthase (glutamine-hydrolysing)
MAKALVHRGPDDEGLFVSPEVALAVRRLSIIDVAGGHQPMRSPSGRVIAFNGEIYNHRELRADLEREGCRFRTTCDTEVALQAVDHWGADGLRRLEGMYGLAVWDTAARTLLLARDPFGQKSIFWAETELGFAFASEIKALLALDAIPRRLDLQAVSHYMTLRYLPERRTFFEGVAKLAAGHRLEATARSRSVERHWTPRYEPKWTLDERETLDELDRLLARVVDQHLMSEVPLGAFLSGGIDSSLVVAYAARASAQPLRTFSVGVDDASQSELPWARRVAERYATRHFETVVQPDLAALGPAMVAANEEPVDPFGAGVYVVSREAARHVTVCLGGDGGDELFAGYDRYQGQALADLYAHLPAPLRRRIARPLLRRVPESFGYKSLASRLRWLDEIADASGVERYARSAVFQPEAWRRVQAERSEELLAAWFADGSADALLDRMLHTDCMTRLADHQLPIVDRMSMAHGLEVRSPFLDRRVAEFAMRIPADWKIRPGRLKHLTRRLGERSLPQDLLDRPKQGFGFPLAHWLRGELRQLVTGLVRESRLVEAGTFRREAMRVLADEHVSGRANHDFRLWMLFQLELFHRHFLESETIPELEGWVERVRRDG